MGGSATCARPTCWILLPTAPTRTWPISRGLTRIPKLRRPPRWQGQGYAQAALRGLLRYCFAGLSMHRMLSLTDTRNLPCVALLKSVGLRREGYFWHNGWYKGGWCDEYQYALLASEWAAPR